MRSVLELHATEPTSIAVSGTRRVSFIAHDGTSTEPSACQGRNIMLEILAINRPAV